MSKTAVLLVNLGTPDAPTVGKVRSYLTQFLNDKRVIDLPFISRKLLVNGIIVPFRAPASTKIYKMLWEDKGSPIIYHSVSLREKLEKKLPENYSVHLAMRYKNPSMPDVLEEIRKTNPDKIILLPLFPHYASATTGSVMEEMMRIISKWWVIPEIVMVNQYYDKKSFIDAWMAKASKYNVKDYDHILFSYHGLPERQVDKVYDEGPCKDHNCETEITEDNKFCYKATCYHTTRLLAGRLGISESDYTVCFQSRLDKKWLEPFSDKIIEEKAKEGAKKLLVFSPAFTADCLETIVEIGIEYQEIFVENGGEKVQLVESLNDSGEFVDCLEEIVLERSEK